MAQSEWLRYRAQLPACPEVRFLLAGDDALGTDGYAIRNEAEDLIVTAPTQRGLLYGAFALIDTCRRAGHHFCAPVGRELPHFPLRMLWSWSRIDNTYRHSPYQRMPSVLTSAAMADPERSPEMMRFIRHMAGMRINALAINHELHHGDLEAYDQHGFRPFYPALRKFSEYLSGWGIDLYLYTATLPEPDFRAQVVDSDCPYDLRVRDFWKEYIEELHSEIPALKGLLLAGGLGGYAGGRLFEVSCPHCAGKTPIEKMRRQIDDLAEMLGAYDMQMVYTVTTDIPFTLDREVETTLSLLEQMPPNVVLTFKNCFHDYEELRYPEHPLLGRLEPRQDLPIAVEMQLFPEMRGKGLILSNATEIWCRQVQRLKALGCRGIIGVIETHPDDAHPSMAEWYAFGKLGWYSNRQPRALLADWTRTVYPPGAEAVLPDILLGSYMAASNTIYAGGMQCGIHGMLCPFPHYIKHKVNDTWCRKDQPLPFGVIGVDDEPMELYEENVRREIAQNPRLFLLNRAHQVTPAVYDRLIREKEAAVAGYTSLYAMWRSVESLFPAEDYRYVLMAEMLQKNIQDARRFQAYFSLFLRWQMGSLTLPDIDAARAELLGQRMPSSINTCGALMGAFLDHLRQKVLGEDYAEIFDNMNDLPQLTVRGWYEGAVRTGEVSS